jgi:predicted ABC-type ATPase
MNDDDAKGNDNAVAKDSKPTMIIYAGAGGAGKSELIKLDDRKIDGVKMSSTALNNYAKGDSTSLSAAKVALVAKLAFNKAIIAKQSFYIENDMANLSDILLIRLAKADGFNVIVRFVGVENQDVALQRMSKDAITRGVVFTPMGHKLGAANVAAALPEVARLADRVDFFDNSKNDASKMRQVATFSKGVFTLREAHGDKSIGWIESAVNAIAKRFTEMNGNVNYQTVSDKGVKTALEGRALNKALGVWEKPEQGVKEAKALKAGGKGDAGAKAAAKTTGSFLADYVMVSKAIETAAKPVRGRMAK